MTVARIVAVACAMLIAALETGAEPVKSSGAAAAS